MSIKLSYLSDEDMSLLESRGNITNYAANEIILSEHSAKHKMFWIRKGIVRIEHSRLYKKTVIAGVGAGETFGEIGYLTDDRATATVVANADVEVLMIDSEVLDELLAADEGLASRFYRTVALTLARRMRKHSHSL